MVFELQHKPPTGHVDVLAFALVVEIIRFGLEATLCLRVRVDAAIVAEIRRSTRTVRRLHTLRLSANSCRHLLFEQQSFFIAANH